MSQVLTPKQLIKKRSDRKSAKSGSRSGKIYGAVSKKQQLILSDKTTDVILVGGGSGGGKSTTTLIKNLDGIHDPHFKCAILRRSHPQLTRLGGLVEESQAIYSDFYGEYGIQSKTWSFPSGAKIMFSAVGCDADLAGWQGSQLVRFCIDEAAEGWTQKQVLFLCSRMRSAQSKIHPQLIMTANPNMQSFLKSWVDFCLDPLTGVPKEGTENIIRYFTVKNDVVYWADSREECFELYGKPFDMIDITGFGEEELKKIPPDKMFSIKTFRFIPTGVMDNPYLLPPKNTSYLDNLLSQTHINQLIFLHGSWTARELGTSFFRREWVEIVDNPPTSVTGRVRSWDLAAGIDTNTVKPDYTAGVKMSKDRYGTYYIEDSYRFKNTTHEVLKEISQTAHDDGLAECRVTIPEDPAAAGKTAYAFYAKVLAENGVYVRKMRTSGHSSKLTRFLPLCSLAESGGLKIVRGDWNDAFLTEMESFRGGRSGGGLFDDQVDAATDAFIHLQRERQMPTFTLPILTQASPVPKV